MVSAIRTMEVFPIYTGVVKEGLNVDKKHMDYNDVEPDVIVLPGVESGRDKRQIRRLIEQRVFYYSGLMGISYGRIFMRNQKTRWGSCSSDGNLNFNCRLLYVPLELLDYVVVHELAHRRHMNHSAEFWSEVERYMPDYRERREKLKQYRVG